MMLSSQSIAAAVFALASATAVAATGPTYTYQFDAASAAGVDGSIMVSYAEDNSTTATISAELDFSAVNRTAFEAFSSDCAEDVTAYKWHIHVDWNSTLSSDSFSQCSKAATGNHYDPLYACSSASEYIDTDTCQAKTASYDCSPSNYEADPLSCEKGDLSGKFGNLELDSNHKVSNEWTDENYPLPSENTATWSMVLHAVCGSEAPRISCAVGTMEEPSTEAPHDGCYGDE